MVLKCELCYVKGSCLIVVISVINALNVIFRNSIKNIRNRFLSATETKTKHKLYCEIIISEENRAGHAEDQIMIAGI